MPDEIKKEKHVEAKLPQAASAPTCPHCGFAVSKKGESCSTCKAREDATPKPMFDLGKHAEAPTRKNPNSVESISPPAGR